jgi:hypothetical protein
MDLKDDEDGEIKEIQLKKGVPSNKKLEEVKTGQRQLNNIFQSNTSEELELYPEEIVFENKIDKVRTLQYLHIDPNMIKYV